MEGRDPGKGAASPEGGSEELEAVWRALANPIRRAILDRLRAGPRTTGALAEDFSELSRFAVMQHLSVLEEAELVIPRREGRRRYNYLNPVPIRRIYERWVVEYMRPWTEALVGLREELETEAPDEARGTQPRRSRR